MTGKCIYLSKSEEELSYNKREHVISAGLGGKTKLPKGVVSDQANEFFSTQCEVKALRSSFLSINRNNLGPGKRGSLSVNKVVNPIIHIFEAHKEEENDNLDIIFAPVKLGFLFTGTTYIIPQILFPINDDFSCNGPFLIMDNYSKDSILSIKKFHLDLLYFINNREKRYNFVESEIKRQNKYILIGKNNEKWFIGTNLKCKQIENFIRILENKLLPEKILTLITSSSIYHYNYELKNIVDDSFPLLYLKTAFNTLAFLKGAEFVLDSQFNEIRNCMMSMKNIDKFFTRKSMPEWLKTWVNSNVNPKEHFIIINAENNYIEAYVSFYREYLSETIILSKNYTGGNFKKGFICNWENSKENYLDIL